MRTLFLKIIPSLIIIILVIYTVIFSLSVQKKTAEWQSVAGEKPVSVVSSAEKWNLTKDRTFLTARLALASNDSIGLTLNIRDSLVQLETKGVVLKQVHFEEAEISRFFKSFNPGNYSKVFSKPFKITDMGGTIVKEPITVKKAPKDSIEAAQNATKMDTAKVEEFVEWHIELNKAFIISLVQSDRKIGNINWPTWEYRLRRHYHTLKTTIQDLVLLKRPAYYPEITIFIPKNEAKSFYRGLSTKGGVVIRF
jgi:hypothetical protein